MIGEILIALAVIFFVLSVGIHFTWTTFFDDGGTNDIVYIILYWLIVIGCVCIISGI